MYKENENASLPMETNNSSNTNEKRLDQEEMMPLFSSSSSSSSSMDQKLLEENRKRKLNELDNETIQQEEEEKRQLNYETLSDVEIKERLFNTMSYDSHLQIKLIEWFQTDPTLLLYIRRHASLLSKYFSLKIELEIYQSYIKMTESVLPWLSEMSKTQLIRNEMNNQFYQIQKYVNKQMKNVENEFAIIKEKLAKTMSDQQQMVSSSPEIDTTLLTSIIVMSVRKDRQGFNDEFIKKRNLLMLNAKDVRLVHEFYHLQPDSQQIELAEDIWLFTIYETESSKNISNNQENTLYHFDYGKFIENKKKQLIDFNKKDENGEDIISMKYFKLNADLLMNIIESRQQTLIQRLEFDNDFKQTFAIDTDETDDNENGNNQNNDSHNNNNNKDRYIDLKQNYEHYRFE